MRRFPASDPLPLPRRCSPVRFCPVRSAGWPPSDQDCAPFPQIAADAPSIRRSRPAQPDGRPGICENAADRNGFRNGRPHQQWFDRMRRKLNRETPKGVVEHHEPLTRESEFLESRQRRASYNIGPNVKHSCPKPDLHQPLDKRRHSGLCCHSLSAETKAVHCQTAGWRSDVGSGQFMAAKLLLQQKDAQVAAKSPTRWGGLAMHGGLKPLIPCGGPFAGTALGSFSSFATIRTKVCNGFPIIRSS